MGSNQMGIRRAGLHGLALAGAVRGRSGGLPRGGSGAFSLLELTLVMGVVLLAILALTRSLGESIQLTQTNEETARATDGAREMVEVLDGVEDFSAVFALYNDDPADDPGPPGTAPGPGFPVAGLTSAADDPDQLVGEILFPVAPGAGGKPELAENLEIPELGMPRDLDGDGEVDEEDHSADYRLLPVTLRLRWAGANGERVLEIHTLLSGR
jgi:hypothetical protein